MKRPVTLYTAQYADLPLKTMCEKAASFGYDGLELACWGDHFEVDKADAAYCRNKRALLKDHGLEVYTISTHLVSQAVSDRIDQRHKGILPSYVWGDGKPDGVNKRAAEEIIRTGEAAARLGVNVVVGFTGSPIWHMLYSFPPTSPALIEEGFATFARQWKPILDVYQSLGVRYALEVHPTEIAFDIPTARMALKALDHHPAFGFNYDPSHMAYQGVDYLKFIDLFADRIFHVHIKDVSWSPTPTEAGVFGGHLPFGARERYWDFRSPGRGRVDFEEIVRRLNRIPYTGPLSVEWEDSGMDREFGAREACSFVRNLDFPPSAIDFDKAFQDG
ncbi:MAG: sugar phosphate isomerase/epimerase [Bacteroidales bacterium]